MAFKFFRRRQKLVVIIMAALMVSFLIGSWGINMLFERDPDKVVVGTTRWGKLKMVDIREAHSDLLLLTEYLKLGDVKAQGAYNITDQEFAILALSTAPELTYALLLKEARSSDVVIEKVEVDNFFAQFAIPIGSDKYRSMITALKLRTKVPAERLHEAVARWLQIFRTYSTSQTEILPSEREVRRVYRDLAELIDVRVAAVKAAKLLDDVPEPEEQDILQQFEQFKSVSPGEYLTVDSFGFGYLQPNRVRILYLFVDQSVIERVAIPGDDAVRRYFRAHRHEFVRKIPVPSAPTTQTATQPAEIRIEPMKFSEVKEQIVQRLTEQAVLNRMEEVLSRAEMLLREYEKTDVTDLNAYEWVKDSMTQSATELLNRKLGVVAITNERLDKAMQILAESAKLQMICYPFGETDAGVIDPSVRVALNARDISLGDALKEISKQAKLPEVNWVTCEGFDNVLFVENGATRVFPISVGQTQLVNIEDLFGDELLGNSFTPAGQPLPQIAFQTDAFSEGGAAVVTLNEDAPRMVLGGAQRGRLLWRLIEAVPSQAAESPTGKLREQVIEDIKMERAFRRAVARAGELIVAAEKDGLEKAADAMKLESSRTGLFARKQTLTAAQRLGALKARGMITEVEALRQLVIEQPIRYVWSLVPGVTLASEELRKRFVETAFSLAPEDVEPKEGGDPYPQTTPALGIVEAPATREVLVLERANFHPVVMSDYEQRGRERVVMWLRMLRSWEIRKTWFGQGDVEKRAAFEASRR
ncbi:MAG: hypothetical protein ACYSTL_01305 [Planctomycetota bacterium]|jgi:hypothetical protein